TTALDVTVQAQILELLAELKERLEMAVVLITHDLGMVAEAADDVLVMYAGRAVERAPVDELFARPMMPYTVALLRSVPRADRPRGAVADPIPGSPPNLLALPTGCPFQPRCFLAQEECAHVLPTLTERAPAHSAACVLPAERVLRETPDAAPAGTEISQ
ncbi:MAG TPA: oligopeptide/dipeptide ABC transporter ATP-binding protein, partial [Pseudonocardiaceae bacterium]|nr:oligopeptide/dipeptide ABC transporter ATP-binding protein [Pseudonocardiaceae bacterium]